MKILFKYIKSKYNKQVNMTEPQESLFISSLRSFFKGFFHFVGMFFAIIIFIIVLGAIFWGKETLSYTSKNSIEILPDLNGNTEPLSEKTPVVLQIDIHKIIGIGNSKSEAIENQLIESRKDLLKNNRVKAILLHMDTGGGAVIDSDNIYRMLLEYKQKYNVPIYAFIDGLNASGGVYISCAADKIFATPVSLVGSVGVLSGPYMNFYKTLEKWGVQTLTLTEGKDKDMMNPLRPWKEDESANLIKLQEYYYNMFVDIVTTARPLLSKEKLTTTYGAHIFPAPRAERYGYIDNGSANYKTALKALLEAANIKENSSYQVVKLNPKKNLMEELFENSALFKGKINHQIKLGNVDDEINDKISFLYLP
jgi:protease IV